MFAVKSISLIATPFSATSAPQPDIENAGIEKTVQFVIPYCLNPALRGTTPAQIGRFTVIATRSNRGGNSFAPKKEHHNSLFFTSVCMDAPGRENRVQTRHLRECAEQGIYGHI